MFACTKPPLATCHILRRNFHTPRPFTLTPRTRDVFVPGLAMNTPIPYSWLRDSCQCSACVHPSTRQKLHRTSDILPDVRPIPGGGGIALANHALRITWEPRSADDPPHESIYPIEWLKRYSNEKNNKMFHRDVDQITWAPPELHEAPHLFVDYSELHDDSTEALLNALTQLVQFGIVFIRGVPNDVTDNDGCELRTLAAKFGRIRNTFYGEVWDVKNMRNSTNIAYTNLDLGLHMDLLYFQHPPRYQILHSLRNQVQGGTSIFVDGIHAAKKLYAVSSQDFDCLAHTPVTFHYINDGHHHLHHAHPTISLSPFPNQDDSQPRPPEVEYINYSPPFQAPLPMNTPKELYIALKRFSDMLEQDRYEYTLKEGEAVVFDNRRILHARTAFQESATTPAGETSRWLKGCYLEADDILNLGRRLREQGEQSS